MDTPVSIIRQKSMPHVVTQWQAREYRLHHTGRSHKSSRSHLKPSINPLPHQPYENSHGHPSPEIAVPGIGWDNGHRYHTGNYSDSETPTSSGGSMFESISGDDVESPNSSIQSEYVAELEDTSFPIPKQVFRSQDITANTWPRRNRPPTIDVSDEQAKPVSPATMEFRTAQMTVRILC